MKLISAIITCLVIGIVLTSASLAEGLQPTYAADLSIELSESNNDLVQLTSLGGYTARWSFDETRIVFTSIRDSNHEIYSMFADGTDQTRLTFHAAYDKIASWYPDGDSIVFVSTRTGNHDIWAMDSDGSNVHVVPSIEHPAWEDVPMCSPDGTKLMFSSSRDGDWEVYTINSDGTGLTQLTYNGVADGNASWSPDGDSICFVSDRDGNYEVYVMSSDSSGQTNISNNPYTDDWPCWLPDGRIAFMSNRDGNEEIYVMNADGSCQTNLTNHPADDLQPHASPNGDWLLFHSDRDGLRNVYKMRIPGSQAMAVHLDIKPGSCPNPLNIKHGRMDGGSTMAAGGGGNRGKKAVLPVAILGTAEFDVAQIDATTVVFEGVPVVRWHYEDVSTPVGDDAEECECNTDGPDGFVDWTAKFYRDDIIAVLGEVYDGDVIPLTIGGQLLDGTPFEGVDCVVILGDNLPMADVGGDDVLFISGVNNYPNPFNPVTTISFSLPVASHVSLEVYNVMGQRVTTVADGFYEAGVHACEWDGSAVASGVYFYRIETPEFAETKKMMLLK